MDQHYVSRYVSPPDYENPTVRALWEEEARYAMTKHCAERGVILLDGAVGKWEPMRQNADDPERVTAWQYRLVGYSSANPDSGAR